MPTLTDEEAEEAFSTLLEELRSSGHGDLIEQVQREIQLGRPVRRTLQVPNESTVADPVAGARASRRTSSAEFVGRKAFTSGEKLRLLLESIELTFVAPTLMAQRIFDMEGHLREEDFEGYEEEDARALADLVKEWREPTRLTFAPEQPDRESRILDESDVRGIEGAVSELSGLLGRLKTEIPRDA